MYDFFSKLYLIILRWNCKHTDLIFLSEQEIELDEHVIQNHKWVCKRCGKVILDSHINNNHIKKD